MTHNTQIWGRREPIPVTIDSLTHVYRRDASLHSPHDVGRPVTSRHVSDSVPSSTASRRRRDDVNEEGHHRGGEGGMTDSAEALFKEWDAADMRHIRTNGKCLGGIFIAIFCKFLTKQNICVNHKQWQIHLKNYSITLGEGGR